MRSANLLVKFLLELAAAASLAYWGAHVGSGATSAPLAVAAPLLMVLVWGRYAAPRAARRLPMRWRIPLELGVLLLASLALAVAGEPVLAAAFAAVVVVNAVALTLFRQWES